MKYKDTYKDCTKCPVYDYCSMIIANSKTICETMPSPEQLEEEYDKLMETGIVDHYDCC